MPALKTSRLIALLLFLLALPLAVWANRTSASGVQTAWLDAAQTLEKRGDWQALLDLGLRWSQSEAGNPLAWFVLGRAYGELKRYPEAIDAYRQNLRVDPQDMYARNNLGNSYHALKHYKEAMAAYHGAVNVNPDYLLAWRNLGHTFYELKGPAGVAQAIQKLQDSDPALADAWRRLAATYALSRNGRVEQEAIQVLRGLSPDQREHMFSILLDGI